MKTPATGSHIALVKVASSVPASGATYDPTTSGLTAEDLQAAIDELVTVLGTFPTDHGDLTGLVPDDDHTQYVLRSILTTRGDLFRRGASVIERVALGADGRLLASDGTDAVWEPQYAGIVAVIGTGASVIPTGLVKFNLRIPFDCVIVRASLLADVSGSIVVDVWADTYANYPPTVADSICAAAKPTLSAAIKASDITLTGWTTTLAEGSTLRFNVDSAATVTCVTLELRVRKT